MSLLPRGLYTFAFAVHDSPQFRCWCCFRQQWRVGTWRLRRATSFLAFTDVGTLRFYASWSLIPTSTPVTPNLPAIFSFTHCPPVLIRYSCILCVGSFTSLFTFYTMTRLDYHSAPRRSGSGCSSSVWISLSVILILSPRRDDFDPPACEVSCVTLSFFCRFRALVWQIPSSTACETKASGYPRLYNCGIRAFGCY